MLRVAIVSTGYEVLRGLTPNTDASWLGLAATEAGALVVSSRTVGDAVEDVARALGEAAAEADVVLATGGLGPTEDDRTREGLARAAGVPLALDPAAWDLVLAHFRRAGREPGETQRRQATLPRGARALSNEEGTAPGVLFRLRDADVVLLPGPPREMRGMFAREVLPRWRSSGRLEPVALRVLWTAGTPEAEIADALADLMAAPEPTVGTHPDEGEVAVRILARGPGAAERAEGVVSEARRRIGPAVVSDREDVRIQHAVVACLRDRALVATTAESITGGLVARMIVEVPGASDVFRGGWVTYSDAWKRDALGVPAALLADQGAVCAEVAEAMARGALERAGADVAISTTGVAGPGPDGRGVPEGTVFAAVALSDGTCRARAMRFSMPRLAVQRRAAVGALDLLRRGLPGQDSNLD